MFTIETYRHPTGTFELTMAYFDFRSFNRSEICYKIDVRTAISCTGILLYWLEMTNRNERYEFGLYTSLLKNLSSDSGCYTLTCKSVTVYLLNNQSLF